MKTPANPPMTPASTTDRTPTADASADRAVAPSFEPLAGTLLKLVDFGMIGILFFAPLFMGGRHPVGSFIYVSIVCVTAMLWSIRQCVLARPTWNRSGGELILLAAVGLLIFQLVPLPPSTMSELSPNLERLLPAWSAPSETSTQLGVWNRLSLAPESTRGALVIFLAHATLFVLVVQRVRSLTDVERIMRWIAVAAVVMAGLGLAQFLVGNGKFLWVYDYPFRDATGAASGAFSNPNHFAHFLALGIAPLIWLLHKSLGGLNQVHRRHSRRDATMMRSDGRSHRQPQRPTVHLAIAAGIAIVLVAGFLSLSRGGFIAIALSAIICVALYARRSLLSGKTVAVLATAGVVAIGALFVYGYDLVTDELATFTAGSVDKLDGDGVRRKLWAANLAAATEFPIFGTGGGSQVDVYPTFYTHYSDLEFTHTENSFLQVFLEFGGVGLALLLAGIVVCGVWSFQSLRRTNDIRAFACAAAATAAIVVSILHSLGDFVWYIPACMSVAVIHVAFLNRICRLAKTDSLQLDESATQSPAANNATTMSPMVWAVTTVTFLGLSVFMIKHELSRALASNDWDQYVRLAQTLKEEQLTEQEVVVRIATMMPHLERSLYFNPNDARANVKMAALCLRRFEIEQNKTMNPMPLAQIRDAVRASGFADRQSQDEWLTVALGDNRKYLDLANRHARRAMWLCPMLGEAYTYAADLAFLDRLPDQVAGGLIEQAIHVRPHHGIVLLAAGNHAVAMGDFERAIGYWKQTFNHDPRIQMEIIQRLAAQAPADFFLSQFKPDREGMSRLYHVYQDLGRNDQANVVGRRYVMVLEEHANSLSGSKAAAAWHEAHGVYYHLADFENALRSARNAVAANSNDPALRRALASMMLQLKHYDEAVEQLRWCLRRNPEDAALKRELDVAFRLNAEARVAQNQR